MTHVRGHQHGAYQAPAVDLRGVLRLRVRCPTDTRTPYPWVGQGTQDRRDTDRRDTDRRSVRGHRSPVSGDTGDTGDGDTDPADPPGMLDCPTMTLKELEAAVAALTPAEKAQLVVSLALSLANASPGIERQPDVMGGDACIVRTRVPVWLLENYRRLGWSEARILDNYPGLRASDLVNAWAYVDAHRGEIEAAIREHDEA
jgi:uncharacterized protein (DUF433 family)